MWHSLFGNYCLPRSCGIQVYLNVCMYVRSIMGISQRMYVCMYVSSIMAMHPVGMGRYDAPAKYILVYLNKGVDGAGRPSSLLAVATSSAKSSSLLFHATSSRLLSHVVIEKLSTAPPLYPQSHLSVLP
jgi:hypothetical protein